MTTRMSDGAGASGPANSAEQAVLQHLEFARQRVADVDLDAAVVAAERDGRRRQILEVEDRALQAGQQRAARRVVEAGVVDHRVAADFEQQAELRLRLLAPGGEQAMAFLVVVGRGATAARGEVGQATAVDDFEPVLAAGVQRVELHVDAAGQRLQQAEVQRRHRRQAEHVRPRPAVRRRAPAPRRRRARPATNAAAGGSDTRLGARRGATARPARPGRPVRRRRARRARRLRRATTPRATRAGR